MSNNQESLSSKQEHGVETFQPTVEKQVSSNNPESTVELSPRDKEARAEEARAEAMHNATDSEIQAKNLRKSQKKTNSSRYGSINKKQRDESYSKIIRQVQDELPAGSRIFSKITHNKIIEKTSDIVGNTIARPDAMLSGAFFAFISTLIIYVIAKTIGYALSGSETITAFVLGWIIGLIYDYFRVLITGKKF